MVNVNLKGVRLGTGCRSGGPSQNKIFVFMIDFLILFLWLFLTFKLLIFLDMFIITTINFSFNIIVSIYKIQQMTLVPSCMHDVPGRRSRRVLWWVDLQYSLVQSFFIDCEDQKNLQKFVEFTSKMKLQATVISGEACRWESDQERSTLDLPPGNSFSPGSRIPLM